MHYKPEGTDENEQNNSHADIIVPGILEVEITVTKRRGPEELLKIKTLDSEYHKMGDIAPVTITSKFVNNELKIRGSESEIVIKIEIENLDHPAHFESLDRLQEGDKIIHRLNYQLGSDATLFSFEHILIFDAAKKEFIPV